jgi:hypothetical protein
MIAVTAEKSEVGVVVGVVEQLFNPCFPVSKGTRDIG